MEAAQAHGQFSGAGARAGLEIPAKRSHATQFHITSHSFTLCYRAAWSGLVEGRSLLEILWPSSATLDFLKLCTSWRTPVTPLHHFTLVCTICLRCAMLCAQCKMYIMQIILHKLEQLRAGPGSCEKEECWQGKIHIFQCLQS